MSRSTRLPFRQVPPHCLVNSREQLRVQEGPNVMSGRFRSEYLTRHLSPNQQGLCLAETCGDTVGDLEHIMVQMWRLQLGPNYVCVILSHRCDTSFETSFRHRKKYLADLLSFGHCNSNCIKFQKSI